MKSELIIDVHPDEIAIALTEDDRLQEIRREKRNVDTYAVGNIYYGRVKKVMPALNAVFVDVGYEKDAFLHYLDLGSNFLTLQKFISRTVSDRRRIPSMRSIEKQPECGKDGQIADYLKVGDTLLVQVTKEPINTKGPRLTAEISLAGRNMVLMPMGDKVMVSNKIRRDSERNKLRKMVQQVRPQGYGVIVRTVAEGAELEDLDSELNILVRKWEDALRLLQTKQPVSLICEEIGRTTGIIRDLFTPEFNTIQVNDAGVYDEVKAYVELISPESVKIVKLYTGAQPIFDHYDITRQLKTGLGRTVGFKNGGYLIIDKTEALFSIDVNSGSKKVYDDQEENAFHYNMLAADEIVHQLRLRDIGGIIIVDYIDMDSKEHQQQLYDYMRKLMAHDRARHNILPLSKFGLMQITRQRVRPAVEMDVTEVCPTCHGKGRIQSSINFTEQLEQEIDLMYRVYGKGMRLHVHPYVYAYVRQGWLSTKLRWWWHYGVTLQENQGVGMLEYHFYNANGQELSRPQAESDADDKIERALRADANPQPQQQPQQQPKQQAKQPKQQAKQQQPKQQPKQQQPKAEQPKAAQVKAEQPKAVQPKAEQPKAAQVKAEQPKAAQVKAEQPKAVQVKAEQPKPETPQPQEEAKPKAKRPARKKAVKPAPEAQTQLAPADTQQPQGVSEPVQTDAKQAEPANETAEEAKPKAKRAPRKKAAKPAAETGAKATDKPVADTSAKATDKPANEASAEPKKDATTETTSPKPAENKPADKPKRKRQPRKKVDTQGAENAQIQ
ncbi:MAG: Rne/Rng family ribonuclease [Paludibacteraceae bacterium]|nr:Rne/Rng family ribonuclease [Paludibacteraceae bacterium]